MYCLTYIDAILILQRHQLMLEKLNVCVRCYAKLSCFLQIDQHEHCIYVIQVDDILPGKLDASSHLKLWHINKLQVQKLVCPELIIFYSHKCQISNLALAQHFCSPFLGIAWPSHMHCGLIRYLIDTICQNSLPRT